VHSHSVVIPLLITSIVMGLQSVANSCRQGGCKQLCVGVRQ